MITLKFSSSSDENIISSFFKYVGVSLGIAIDDIILLADKYFAEDMLDEAFNLLLSNYKKNKEKTKEKLLEYFEALGNSHEKTIFYRKKLSSIIFS